MNWAWASSLDYLWRSPSFPMWLTLAAAGFFAIILLVTLLRAERSVANGALTVITLLAIGVAAAATIRGFGPGDTAASADKPSPPAMSAALPALACIDDVAGETVLTACEKTLFGSAETTAAAISYAASQITRLTSFGDVATANRNFTTELESLRRAVERDRYGLMAYVLAARDHCTATACPAFRSLANNRQIVANMDDRVYEGMVMRYSDPECATARAGQGRAAGKPTKPHGFRRRRRRRRLALWRPSRAVRRAFGVPSPRRQPRPRRCHYRARHRHRPRPPSGRRRAARRHHADFSTGCCARPPPTTNDGKDVAHISGIPLHLSSLPSVVNVRELKGWSPNGWRPRKRPAVRHITSADDAEA
jgi:hypothetical protein